MSNETQRELTDTERLDMIERVFRNQTVSFSFMRYGQWEASQPWLCDRHNYGHKRWSAMTLRDLIDGLAREYREKSGDEIGAEAKIAAEQWRLDREKLEDEEEKGDTK